MPLPEYEYKGLMAQSWDLLRGDTSGWEDRPFFLEAIRRFGQPALDVGCGTGRLLLDYLQQGIDIDGVDNSPEMLALCRSKADALDLAPVLYEQYIEALNLPRRYRTIIIPSSSIQLITEPDALDAAMTRLTAHMEPGGALVAAFMSIHQPGDPLFSEWEKTVERPEDGTVVRRVARSWYDPATECESTEDVYQVMAGGAIVAEETLRRSPATRSYNQATARRLFERAGLIELEVRRFADGEPAGPDDWIFFLSGRRP